MIPYNYRLNKNGHSRDKDYRQSHDYWMRQPAEQLELMGVSDIGGCGLTEVLYRHFDEVRQLKKLVTFDRGKTVLELGSGNGRWVLSLAPLVKYYTAIDFSQQMLDIARRRAEKLRLDNVTFCRASVQNYTPPIPFDIVYLSGVSQYLHDEDLRAMLERLKRSLRPGAVLIDRSTIHRRQRLLTEQSDYFCIYRTAEEIERLFEEAGFLLNNRQQSYVFLNVPAIMRRFLSFRQSAAVVSFTAPLSFHMLSALARASGHIWGAMGEAVDFSHDFFIFHRGT